MLPFSRRSENGQPPISRKIHATVERFNREIRQAKQGRSQHRRSNARASRHTGWDEAKAAITFLVSEC
jgi:hypothetical protein